MFRQPDSLWKNGTLLLFCFVLFLFLIFQGPLLGALAIGFVLFAAYGLRTGHSAGAVLRMAWHGVQSVRTIFLVFLLIGMLTGVWRACGTIAYLVTLSLPFIQPAWFLLAAFLCNCAISFLLGSSFATAATMGVITMKIGLNLGVAPLYTGGAILSGVYFGDRMSPVSTSALLVSVLTRSDFYRNLHNMARSGLLPCLLAGALYLVLGMATGTSGSRAAATAQAFTSLYTFSPWLLLPVASILVCSFLRIPVKLNMAVSIVLAALLCALVQHLAPADILGIMVFGFHSPVPALAPMVDGGGIMSMLRVGAIVCLSSSFSGIFDGTGLMDGVTEKFQVLARRFGNAAAVTLAALFTALIACNQSFSIILTHQLSKGFGMAPERLALCMENTAVVLSPLVPWSIACAVVLDATGAPAASVPFAWYLYLLPLWNLCLMRKE